jgi:SAM-dependent methyltransferase
MVGCNRASIFNPATYKGIMQEIFTGETVFAPVMGWNAYQLGYYSTDWRHFIATDVIPEVVDNGRWLHTEWQRYKNNSLFEIVDKTVDLYCCPSEQLDQQHGFEAKYKNQVDAVLFSPPYYDLEIYDSADQSFTNYPDYATWLREYWEQTVELCCEVLRPGGKFAFVISNYRNKNKQEVSISQDMQAVVAKHLPLSQQLRVQWSAIAVSRQAKKTRDGNYEDLWIFTK